MRNIYGPSLGVVCLLIALVGCGGSGNPGGQSSAAPASSPSAQAVRLVVLGDSDATGTGDPTGQGWVGRYAALVHKATGSPVHVTNLAVDGKTSDVLLTEVRSDPVTRQALRGAQVVLLGIGGADDQGPVLLPKRERPTAHGPAALPSRPRAPPQLIARPAFRRPRHVLPRLEGTAAFEESCSSATAGKWTFT
jgi:hypothetical protein